MTFHTETIGSAVTANASRAQDFLAGLNAQMQGSAGGEAAIRAVAQLARLVQQQALVMTYSDLFWIFGVIVVCTIPLAFLLKPLPKGTHLAMH